MRNYWILPLAVLILSCTEQQRFEQLNAERTGIHFINEVIEKDTFHILNHEYMYNGGGVGIGDLNNDGLSDVIFTGNLVSTTIYLNKGDFQFEDISRNFEGLSAESWISGVAIADVNADGWLDIYLTATFYENSLRRKNQLWINQGANEQGQPAFKEMGEAYGVADVGYSVHAAFMDYDLDGDLDLYVLNNVFNKNIPSNYRPKITDGSAINNDQLYENLGTGEFTNVTKKAGITYEGYGLGISVGDVNKDGYPDVYVSNDYTSNDLLYINRRDGTFKNVSENYISYHSRFSMGNDMADFNNDGNPDIITLDMLPEKYFRKKQTINGHTYTSYVNDEKYGYQHQYVRNMVHMHNGFQEDQMLPYSEVGQLMDVFETEWSWSPLFADYDNDGDRDLIITNGYPKDLTDKDFTNYKANVLGYLATAEDLTKQIPVVKVSNYVYENKGAFQFQNVTGTWGMEQPSFSYGAAFVDLDNDGDLDYLVNNINDKAFVYKNNTSKISKNNYIRFNLLGNKTNTLALGAKVELWSNGDYQYYEHYLSRGYISSVEPKVHFGMKDKSKIDSIKVTWPGHKAVTKLYEIESNQMLTLKQSEAEIVNDKRTRKASDRKMFESYSSVIDYTHSEEDFIDFFQYQKTIQHKFSQLGPCMAKGDLDNDGEEDLIIGASSTLPTRVYLKKGNKFMNTEFQGLTERRRCQESDLVITDLEGDGDNDVVALAGGYAHEDEETYKHYVYVNDQGKFQQQALNLPPFPASVVRAVDFDRDGDEDFFVGARVKWGAFPYAENSYLLVNDEGILSPGEPFSFNLGMVTDAIWTDYNSDGWMDLLIAREWNTIVLLENEGGKSFKRVNTSLDDYSGLWSALAKGDLDGDGDDDYLVGNLGKNQRFYINNEYPMNLYAVDIDDNGHIDPLITSYWEDSDGQMKEFPIHYLDELAAQSPVFRKKFTSYKQFSISTIDDILNTDSLPDGSKFKINTVSSYIIWNEGGGDFTWKEMPVEMQMAPIKELLVRDFNGDKNADVLVAGNDHSYETGTGLFSANKGYLLLGAGNRVFEVVPPAESGILLNGQVESMLYFEGDTSYVVAGINRDSVRVFRHVKIK